MCSILSFLRKQEFDLPRPRGICLHALQMAPATSPPTASTSAGGWRASGWAREASQLPAGARGQPCLTQVETAVAPKTRHGMAVRQRATSLSVSHWQIAPNRWPARRPDHPPALQLRLSRLRHFLPALHRDCFLSGKGDPKPVQPPAPCTLQLHRSTDPNSLALHTMGGL